MTISAACLARSSSVLSAFFFFFLDFFLAGLGIFFGGLGGLCGGLSGGPFFPTPFFGGILVFRSLRSLELNKSLHYMGLKTVRVIVGDFFVIVGGFYTSNP